jgi:ATP-grasp domain, R2K clade family 2
MILVRGPRYSNDARILSQAATMQGWEVVKLNSSSVPDELLDQECRIYAEGFLVEHVAQSLGLNFLRPANDGLASLEPEFLQRKVAFSRAADFKPLSVPVFIKPADQKLFSARVYTPNEPIPGLESLHPDDPILVSDVVEFVREYRFFILGRTVRTGSIYWLEDHMPDVPVGYEGEGDPLWAEAISFAQRVCTESFVQLVDSFVLDVGLLDTGAWAVIEFNPTWASGIYACDPFGVLECLVASQRSKSF